MTPMNGAMQYMTSTPYTHADQFLPPVTPYNYQDNVPVNDYGDDLNKSDSEKVLAKKLGSVNFRSDDLDILYNARGKEIDKLQQQLADVKAEYEAELRSCRHQLALVKSEHHNSAGDIDQLRRVVSDTKRENKVLTDEIHNLSVKIKILVEENESLQIEKESSSNIIQQLQIQLSQLQTNDSVLKARNQHEATVRSIVDRHKEEVGSLRLEVDKMNTKLVLQEQENTNLHQKLRHALSEKEEAVRSKLETVTELSGKLTEALQSSSGEELVRLRAELRLEKQDREKETKERRKLEREVDQLKVEIGALEALQGGHEESAVQLGLGGAEADVASNQRVRDELHRSLISNRTKREEISRLEASLKTKDRELDLVHSKENEYVNSIESLRKELHSASINASQNLFRNSNKEDDLRKEIEVLEIQNADLKRHISDIVEGNDADKKEAIDELREEYEAHLKEAVEETKLLMGEEVKKLRIEIDVYDKTLLDLRNKLSTKEEEYQELSHVVKELQFKPVEKKENHDSSLKDIESKLRFEMEKEFNTKLDHSKAEMREIWKIEAKLQAEEAVASARLDWIRNLPDIQKNGGVRESIGELERVKQLLEKEKEFKLVLENKLFEKESEVNKLIETQNILQRKSDESRREGMKEVEDSLGKELKDMLKKQQEQWENIVKSTREEAELSRHQLVQHWESQLDLMEQKLRKTEKEMLDLQSKERQCNSILEQMKRTLNEKELTIERMKKVKQNVDLESRKEKELKLLQEELLKRNNEVQNQREEMSRLVIKWQNEMEDIQSSHQREKQELDDYRNKYHLLKSKVIKYRKHMEAKEDHYKSEYTRLETEFRGTLEKLRERMELAYSSKERMVDTELGNMKDQLTKEMRTIIGTGSGQSRPQSQQLETELLSEQPVKLSK